ncbi:MAG: response regulator transcription factor [Clostridiaceae bacterium]|nr:response regulator transcription factor [Clostridiaceae bacterium]
MPKILLIEDDAALRSGLAYALGSDGFDVLTAGTLAEARGWLRIDPAHVDLILLDVLLPDGNGYDFCAELKTDKQTAISQIPIIFLTACDSEIAVVRGLDGGGDDYLTKPFRIRELTSRIHAVLRRHMNSGPAGGLSVSGSRSDMRLPMNRQVGGLHLDGARFKAWQDGQELTLTALEFRLLAYLMDHAGQVLSRNQILGFLWDERGDFVDDNTLSVHIRHLREKIEKDPACPQIILTIRGVGYQMTDPLPAHNGNP